MVIAYPKYVNQSTHDSNGIIAGSLKGSAIQTSHVKTMRSLNAKLI